jgi:hypothetical protein
VLQLAGQSSAIPEILVQPPREQPHSIAVAQFRSGAEPLVQRPADDPVMIDQRQGFVGDNRFQLIFGRTRARQIGGARLCRNMVAPVPA